MTFVVDHCVTRTLGSKPPEFGFLFGPGPNLWRIAMIDCLSFCCFTTIETILLFYTFGSRDLVLKLRRL